MKKTNVYISKYGIEIPLNVNNNKERDRPHQYLCWDADINSDITVSRHLDTGDVNENFIYIVKLGLAQHNKLCNSDLNIDDYYHDFAEWIGNNWRRLFLIDQCVDESLHDRKKDILWLVQMAQFKENNLVLNGFACWIEEQYKEYEREEEEDEVGK